jgi:large conductance mechanosensitive channel
MGLSDYLAQRTARAGRFACVNAGLAAGTTQLFSIDADEEAEDRHGLRGVERGTKDLLAQDGATQQHWRKKMASGGFKQFILRGNVVDLAVGVVMGAAFGTVVSGFVKDLLTPLIAAVVGKQDFSAMKFTINGSQFLYGDLMNALVSFLLIAAAVYYFVVLPVNTLMARARKEPPADPTTKKCPECRSEIPLDARRCAFCAQVVA